MLDNATLPGTPNTVSQSGTGTHDASITPAFTGSRVFAAEVNYPASATTPVAAAGNTALDALSDTMSNPSQDYGFGSFESTATMTSGTPFTAGSTDNAAGGAAVIEVEPSGTITTDASSPASVSSVSLGAGVTSATTAAFNPPPGSLLIALVAAAGDPFGQVSMTVTDSYGLVWAEAVRANATGNGYAGIWYAFAPAALTVSTSSLPGGAIGYPYSAALMASGGFLPYTWTLATGSLPAGLALNGATGVIFGTPITAGTSTFTVTVTGSGGNAATSGSLSITIAATPPAGVSIYGSWIGQASQYTYGTLAIPVATRDHDWLFVACSWADGEDTGTVAYCTDNVHNVYRSAAYKSGSVHTQIFAVPNARAASTIYVSTSAYVYWLTACVIDVANIGAGYVVDGTNTAGGSSTTIGLSVTATAADFVLAAGCFTGTPESVSQSGTGATWNAISGGTNGMSGSGISQAVSWAAPTGAGTLSMTFTSGSSRPNAGALVAVKQDQAALVNSNPAWPTITVQAAFGYTPGNPSGPPTWTDITSRFLGFNGQRGKNFELDELSAADMTMTLDNFDGALSPQNQSSPYWPNVTLITPVQVLADWQGRRYCIFTGLITALPQTYEFERSIIEVALSDDYSKLPQILLPSCMVSELLYDQPVSLWPMNDVQGANQASNWSGRSTNILVPINGKYGGGSTGSTPSTGFGNSLPQNFPTGLEGTSDTAWGDNPQTFTVGGKTAYKGTALVDRDDTSLPLTATGATYECWALIESTWGSATLMTLRDEKGGSGGGMFFNLVVISFSSSSNIYVSQATKATRGVQSFAVAERLSDSHWHHYALTISTSGLITLFLDGNSVGSFRGVFPTGKPSTLSFGGDPSLPVTPAIIPEWGLPPGGGVGFLGSVNIAWLGMAGFFDGLMVNGAVFDRVLDPERIKTHYQSGQTGFVSETTGTRVSRVLTYARWSGPQAVEPGVSHMQIFNYLANGYASSGLSGAIGNFNTAGGAAGIDQGAQADVTIQDIANSECGSLFVGADGCLTFRERDTSFNPAVNGSLGDQDYALNRQSTFATGLGPWTNVSDCTITTSNAWSYEGGKSALMTVTGTSQATLRGETLTAATAGVSMWVMSPAGCWVRLAIDWYGTSGYISTTNSGDTWCPPMTPVHLTMSPRVPAVGATSMQFGPTIFLNAAAGQQLYIDRIRISPAGFQVPYLGDVQITEDIQYLFNDIAVTRNIDQATYRAVNTSSRNQYYPRVYLRTIYTAEGDPQAVVDVANWLLNAYDQPNLRVPRITVDAAADPELWPFVLGTDIGDLVSFQRTPVEGAVVQSEFVVISVEPDIGPDKAEFTYVLAPAPGLGILTLDDPVYGLVGGSNELGW